MQQPRPTPVTGIVVDVLGRPIADAWVVLCVGSDDDVSAETRTGEDGRFVFAAVVDAHTVLAKAAHTVRASEHLWRYGRAASSVRIELAEAGELLGLVTDEVGAPLEHVDIMVRPVGWSGDECTTRTDSQGRYSFDAVPIGRVRVSAWRADRQLVFVEHEVRAEATLDLQLAPACQRIVRFRIVGASAQQLAQAKCWMHDFENRLPKSCLRGVPDEHGVWEVRGLPNEWEYHSLHVSLPGMQCEPLVDECPAHPESGCYEFVFTVHAHVARKVHGRLTTERGEPVVAAALEVGSNRAGEGQVVTGADGRFVITTIVPDGETLGLCMKAGALVLDGPGDPRWASPVHRRRFVVEMPCQQELTLRAVPAATLRGRCVMADGTPCANALVQLRVEWQSERGEVQSQLDVTESDADGWFTFAGHNARLGGTVHVFASRGLWQVRSAPVLLQAGAKVELPPLIAPPVGSISGVLRNAVGQPMAGEPLLVLDADAPEPEFRIGHARTSRDGRFRITDLGAGIWRLQSAERSGPPRWSSEAFVLRAGEALQRDFVTVLGASG